ncbi:Pyruvate/2-oxoglutarate dehydrogenase complex dehydrogenase (E1) component [Gaiella occulta]|uniref:Pyruvate/2-oxoglutarate dehydrogenase complex dehydrogenase (E1) component n=1 Tax=Gaiella occulta TaxID=1002870 RepID=A0A7M2YW22_9ACTN|nr:transketolase C-terminal domain-containing protein [Gaiella occulta]RDI73628.1 Pyruvate/2-oxoglutarate dehydrogenase complex dehydrogenase (E1) component [Gaiella occulta]
MQTLPETRELTYMQAVTEAQRWALETYPEAIVFGEDIGLPGGPYGSTKGLRKAFGERVFDTPISESAILGGAIGAAMRGRRPIVEIMFADFFLVALDQLVNQAANVRFLSRGEFTAPITVRSQQGFTPGSCAQHSQSLEAIFAHTPGLRIGLPADAERAYTMLRAAIASDDPVIVVESRALYQQKREVRLGGPVEAVGGARVVREGSDVTIVSWSRMVGEALTAADRLAERGIRAEVVDLCWLSPLDMGTVLDSVRRTSRLVIAHEANLTGGFGAEIAARVVTDGFDLLDAPIGRVGAPDIRVPASPALQQALMPNSESIVAAVDRLASF